MSNILTILFNMLNLLILQIYIIVLHHLTVRFAMCICIAAWLVWILLLVVVTLQFLHLQQYFLLLVV